MKIFWFEVKKAGGGKIGLPTVAFWGGGKKNYSTVVNSNGINLDGESISKNFNTFWGMYETNTDVFKCVEVKQKMVMKKGFTLMRKNTTDDKMKLSKDPDFIKALGDVDALKNDIIQALEICADVFIRRRRNLLKEVIGYEVLDTREVSVVTDPLLKPLRYTYRRKTVASVTVETYPAEDIDHWKIGSNWNNVLFGLSPLRTLIYEVFGDLEAGMVNYYWYKNDAVPSSLYVLKEGLTPEEQANAIKDVQDTLKGSHNAGKSMVTNAITDVKTFQKDEQGSLDIEKRRYNTEKICAGLGVPRAVLNYIEGVNLANMDGMIKLFIENTIEPYERLIEKIFTSLSQDFQGLYFVINSDHLDQMEQKSKLYRENVAWGINTINEARDELGFEKSDNPLADELLVGSSLQLIDNLLMGEPEDTEDEKKVDTV